MSDDYRVEKVFESEMTITEDDRLQNVFNTSLLDHIIKYYHDDADDIRMDGREPRRIRYRVVIEVMDVPLPEKLNVD